MPQTVTTNNGTVNIVQSNPNGDGHRANPIVYPDAGSILIQGLPPKFHAGASSLMWGRMTWSGHLFYYDNTGTQIGGIRSGVVTMVSSPTNPPQITIPQNHLISAVPTTDMNGDGRGDFTVTGKNSADIVAYKIDFTADTALGRGDGNSGMFLYFVRQGQPSPF